MWPDRISNPGPLTHESGALPTALRGRAIRNSILICLKNHLLGSYFLALTRKINLVSEFCAHCGAKGGEGHGVGMGRETELKRGEETIHAIDMEDFEGNVNRAGAEKKFQAVFFIFNSLFSLSKKNSVANSNDTVAYIVKISYKQLYSGTYLKKKTL